MDRLEKALEKARQQRSEAAAETEKRPASESKPAPQAGTISTEAAAKPKAPNFSSKAVDLSEQEMEKHRVISRRNRDSNADAFRILRTKVMQTLTRSNLQTVAVTSAGYGEGKTTIAINLALSLALDVKQTVLLVDLDLRDPTIHTFLGIPNDVGISDYILHDKSVPDCLVRTGYERLSVLPSGRPMENSSELLGTPKMIELARQLKSRYPDRVVIYDMPPVLTQDDTIVFLPNVDAVLLVARDGVSIADDVKQAIYSLSESNLIGTVLNDSVETSVNAG